MFCEELKIGKNMRKLCGTAKLGVMLYFCLLVVSCSESYNSEQGNRPEWVLTKGSRIGCDEREETASRTQGNLYFNMGSILTAENMDKRIEFEEETQILRSQYAKIHKSLARKYGNYNSIPTCIKADYETWLLEKTREVVSHYLANKPTEKKPQSTKLKIEGDRDWKEDPNITVWEPNQTKTIKVGYRAEMDPDFIVLQCLNDLRADFLENVNYVSMSEAKYDYWKRKAGQVSSSENDSKRKTALACGKNKDFKPGKCRKLLNSCKKDQRRLRLLYDN